MILLRLIILGLLLWVGYRLLRKYLSTAQRDTKPPTGEFQPMVTCEHCGLHLPRNDALAKNQLFYCCQAHLQASDK